MIKNRIIIIVIMEINKQYDCCLIFKIALNQNIFKYNSQQLRLWNEVATIFLISIIFLVVVKQAMSLVWGLLGLVLFILILLSAIK